MERFGKVLQKRQSMTINRNDKSTSFSTQIDSLIPPSKISNLTQGMFVGAISDNFVLTYTNLAEEQAQLDFVFEDDFGQKVEYAVTFAGKKTDEGKEIVRFFREFCKGS